MSDYSRVNHKLRRKQRDRHGCIIEPLKEGAPTGRVWEREPLPGEYYAERGWDKNGVPTPAKLHQPGPGPDIQSVGTNRPLTAEAH